MANYLPGAEIRPVDGNLLVVVKRSLLTHARESKGINVDIMLLAISVGD